MTDKTLHRNTLIFAGIVIVALMLWAYFHDKIAQALAGQGTPAVQYAGEPVFVVQGGSSSYGPVTFPAATFNIPPTPLNGVYNPGSCECGCAGGMGGPVTFSFPDMTQYFTNLQEQNNAAISNAFYAAIGGLPYDEQVMIANNTPTPFGT